MLMQILRKILKLLQYKIKKYFDMLWPMCASLDMCGCVKDEDESRKAKSWGFWKRKLYAIKRSNLSHTEFIYWKVSTKRLLRDFFLDTFQKLHWKPSSQSEMYMSPNVKQYILTLSLLFVTCLQANLVIDYIIAHCFSLHYCWCHEYSRLQYKKSTNRNDRELDIILFTLTSASQATLW